MRLQKQIDLQTRIFELDWNRHITSRTYENFSLESRYKILADLAYPVEKCIEENIQLIPLLTEVRFLDQQFSEVTLKVNTDAEFYSGGKIFWNHEIIGNSDKLCCTLKHKDKLVNSSGNPISLEKSNLEDNEQQFENKIHLFSGTSSRLEHTFHLKFSDMNFFWTYPPSAIWKVFEEGRFLFFNEVIGISNIQSLGTTTFFMGGQIQYFKIPEPGSLIKLFSWIELVDKIRFYFRQDVEDTEGNLLLSMRDEQLFVSLSRSRPVRAPEKFLELIDTYIENK